MTGIFYCTFIQIVSFGGEFLELVVLAPAENGVQGFRALQSTTEINVNQTRENTPICEDL